jgi:large subunit ribosomal protein L21
MDYAIIKLGNKQHRVRDGETLVVDRLPTEAGKSFEPVVLLGETKVTATVLEHGRGPKLIIGKYRKRTGYKRHNGFRASTSKVEITIGAGTKRAAAKTEKPVSAEKRAKTEQAEALAATEAPTETAATGAAPTAETPTIAEAGLPAGYAEMTVAQISAGAKEWSTDQLEAALAHEQAHAARKGAISALESAIKKEAEDGA